MNEINTAIRQYLQAKGYKKLSLKAVLFDMDGVLYDSMPIHASSWSAVMRNHGLNMSEEEAYLHEGRIGVDTINMVSEREGKSLDIEEQKNIYREKTIIFASHPPASIMAGSQELLQKVMADGLFAMLVTGSGQSSLLDGLNQDFPGIFMREKMVTALDVAKGKPHPEPYLTALQKGGLRPYEAIVIENAPLGIEAAYAAGLFVIAVNTGPLPDSVLLDAGANILYPSLKALADEWDKDIKKILL